MPVPLRVRSAVALAALLAVLAAALPAAAPPAVAQADAGILPIGTVQGAVGDSDDGLTHRSPFAPPSGNGNGQTVVIQGVITQRTLTGSGQNGLFVQDPVDTADDDPTTSDGIFVFIGGFTTLRVDGGGFYTPRVGDEVVLRGPVAEFFNLTQLSNPFLVDVVRTGVDLDAEVGVFEADPPDDLDEANRYWERREGMRGRVPAGSIVLGGREVFGDAATGADGEVWVAHGDHPIAQREDPFTRRAFRDAHPLDNNPGEDFDDGNGYRILFGSLGLKAATGDRTALVAPARTYDTVTNVPAGGLYFSFGKYQLQPEEQLALDAGADPADNAPPSPAAEGEEYAVATFNLENLYDFRDDPFDGCDFPGNPGCPGVNPPFDYVPPSDEVYQARLDDLADQIVADLHAPEIIAVQEAEDQDICVVEDATLVCGDTDDADGRPDTLQELALRIAERGGPPYDAALDRDGADNRGIVSGFLYRTDRVELLPPDEDDPALGADPAVEYRGEPLPFNGDVQNPKALNAALPGDLDRSTGVDGTNVFTRPPQVARFRVWRTAVGGSVFTDLVAISNHFSAGPGNRVGQRTEQAAYNAAIVEALRADDPDVRVVVGGDFNVYPRPDDPLRPGDQGFPSDQLGSLYKSGLTNLYDVLLDRAPAGAFSYVFQGQTQTLDMQFVTDPLLADLRGVAVAHVNADWPAAFDGYGPRGASDHDPQVARFASTPTVDGLADLVRLLAGEGRIQPVAEQRLLAVLERAHRAAERGNARLARTHLEVFRTLAAALSPRLVEPSTAAVLRAEAVLVTV